MRENFVLTLVCQNRPGIVSLIATKIFEGGGDILEAQQFDDEETSRFFMRVVFALNQTPVARVEEGLAEASKILDMHARLQPQRLPRRVVLLVSRFDHCLVDLLYRHKIGELAMDICAIIANYPRETHATLDFGTIPFYFLPVNPATKAHQERQISEIIDKTKAEFIILARYMQILSHNFVERYPGRCINIHHSFLPGFKGAKPYHQAFERGVKLIGATAHFVTADLDEGPIIDQDVERITHSDSPQDLVRKGRDIERRVLARAVRFVLEDRVLINGQKTVVFSS